MPSTINKPWPQVTGICGCAQKILWNFVFPILLSKHVGNLSGCYLEAMIVTKGLEKQCWSQLMCKCTGKPIMNLLKLLDTVGIQVIIRFLTRQAAGSSLVFLKQTIEFIKFRNKLIQKAESKKAQRLLC